MKSESATKQPAGAGFELVTPDFVREILYQLRYQATLPNLCSRVDHLLALPLS